MYPAYSDDAESNVMPNPQRSSIASFAVLSDGEAAKYAEAKAKPWQPSMMTKPEPKEEAADIKIVRPSPKPDIKLVRPQPQPKPAGTLAFPGKTPVPLPRPRPPSDDGPRPRPRPSPRPRPPSEMGPPISPRPRPRPSPRPRPPSDMRPRPRPRPRPSPRPRPRKAENRKKVPNNGACDWGWQTGKASCEFCAQYVDGRQGGWKDQPCVYVPSRAKCYPHNYAYTRFRSEVSDCNDSDMGLPTSPRPRPRPSPRPRPPSDMGPPTSPRPHPHPRPRPRLPSASTCSDDKSFKDTSGFNCFAWRGYDCYAAEKDYGYTKQAQKVLLNKCRKSCESCEEDNMDGGDMDGGDMDRGDMDGGDMDGGDMDGGDMDGGD